MGARVELRDKWTVPGDEATVRRRVVKFLRRCGMEPVEEDDGALVAKQGSQLKTRLLGGWFVSAESLPKQATVEFKPVEGGVRVRAVIEETLGFGILDPILADKYKKFFATWLDDLDDLLRPDGE